jgi:hypothetical protein
MPASNTDAEDPSEGHEGDGATIQSHDWPGTVDAEPWERAEWVPKFACILATRQVTGSSLTRLQDGCSAN